MVYCGRPSQACAECRARRTRCDYKKPSCSQCIRMRRTCKGYRDPVSALFRDESERLAIKRQRVTGPKETSPAHSGLSSQEIDEAMAACSASFDSSPSSDSDQKSKDSLIFESMIQSLGACPAIEDQGAHFLHTEFSMKDPSTFDDSWDHYAFVEARDAVAGNPTPQSVGGPSHYAFCEGVIDSHLSYDMPFRERGYIATQQPKRSIPDYLTRRVPNDSEDDLISIDPDLLDFDRMTEQPLLDDFTFSPALLSNLSWPMDLQAPCYFFANYVLENTSDSQGYLEYLPKLCQNDVSNSFLMDAVTSLGLAGLAVRRHDSNALNFSRLKYSSALNQLNIALTSTENALTDQALITVFLLGLYEINTCSTPQNLQAWTKHVGGAIALLQLRGKEQLDSPVGRQIFVQWRNQIVALCLHRRIAVPDFVLEWSPELLQHETPDEAMGTSLSITTAKLCALRADMKYFRNYSKSGSVVPWALLIEAELVAWADQCSAAHKYTSVTLAQKSEFAYEENIHVYSSPTVATVWNEYRKMRILCHEIILQHLPHLIEQKAELSLSIKEMKCQLYDSKEIIERLARDICASVPFFFGVHEEANSGNLAPKAVCGNLLLRPLYMAAEPRFVSNHVRKWVIGRFERIAEVMGVKQATSLAHLVKIGIDPDEWEKSYQDTRGEISQE